MNLPRSKVADTVFPATPAQRRSGVPPGRKWGFGVRKPVVGTTGYCPSSLRDGGRAGAHWLSSWSAGVCVLLVQSEALAQLSQCTVVVRVSRGNSSKILHTIPP